MYMPIPFSPKEVYHYTKKANVESILNDGVILRHNDTECWFSLSLYDMLIYMGYTVMVEGAPYITVGGGVKHFPKFKPEDFVVLKLEPLHKSMSKWVRWVDDIPNNKLPKEHREAVNRARVGYRGNLRFKPNPEILEMVDLHRMLKEGAIKNDL